MERNVSRMWLEMISKKKIIFSFIMVLLLSQLSLVVEADSPILEVSTQNIYLTAGQENQFTINLQNTGDSSVYNVEAFLVSEIPGLSILTDSHKVFNEIAKNKLRDYEPTIYVDQSLPLGSYSVMLTLKYRKFGTELDTQIIVPIGLVVNEAYVPKIQYTSGLDSGKISSGSEKQVQFNFRNNWGRTLHDLEFTLSSTSPYISIVDGISKEVDTLATGQSASVEPTLSVLDGTPLSVYTVTATVTYTDADGKIYHQTFILPINVNSREATRNTVVTLEQMSMSPDSVHPGDIFDLEFEVACDGAEAYNILTNINFGVTGSISPLSPTIANLQDLEPGQSSTVTYKLLAGGDISAGQYPVTITISYTDSKGMPKTLSESLTILIQGLIEFELLDEQTTMISPGKEGELEADLLLVGTESVQFVSVELVEDNVFKRTQGSEEYIGAVDPDSPIPFDLNFKVSEDADEGDHDMRIRIQYRDHLNVEHDDSVDMTVKIGEESPNGTQQASGNPIWNWIRRILGLGP